VHAAGPNWLENGRLGTWGGPCWPEGPGTQQRCWLLRLNLSGRSDLELGGRHCWAEDWGIGVVLTREDLGRLP
jgi:hypothetical protein